MSTASVRHIVRCAWWLAVTWMTISLCGWLIVRHDRHAAAVLELVETQGYALDAGSLLGAFLNALLPEGISLPQAMALTLVLAEAATSVLLAMQCRHMVVLIRARRFSREIDQTMRVLASRQLLRTSLLLLLGVGVLIGAVRYELVLLDPLVSPIDRLLNLFHDPVISWVTGGVWRSASLTVVGALWVVFAIDRLGETFVILTRSVNHGRL